jgi:glycosyltransferase involved in cell wall biosynthesis
MLLSICIPSYNRPESLLRLLQSVDAQVEKIEIVIAEDHAPRRKEVSNQVNLFKESSVYQVVYHENEINLGYDANIRSLLSLAKGNFVLFMGDDDAFKQILRN